MGSLTALLDMSRQTLAADQAALNITSNNIANQNTPGYTREVATWHPGDTVNIGGLSVGSGASVDAISQRDRVLEQRVQQQTQIQSQSAALSTALRQVVDVFGLTSSSTSSATTALGSAIDSFFNSLSTLTTHPSDSSTRQSVLSAASTLVNAFNSAANQLSSISSGLDQQAGTIVGQVNSLTSAIASLNQQISALSPNADAGTLEDQRQHDIAQLSQYIGLNQITTENNGITLTTSNGAVLVSGNNAYALNTTTVSGVTHILAGAGTPQDVTSGLTGGQLGGILEARDQQIPTFSSQLDQLAYAIGTQLNQRNQQGFDDNGNPGQALFILPATASGAAATIAVATTNPQAIAAAASGEGSSGSGNALAMSDLADTSIVSGQTASGFFATFLGQLGSAAAQANTDNTTQQATLSQLTTQRDSLSGVSLDEEAANLTQYQRSYEAAAKVFTIVDTLLANAINLGEQTTVS
ncbi:flagellar hook-associated protein FlgK [Edaphobacter bradus]|uniref:flagellar hook-associated protein FlgK n=1 Tax=Edaphobacter bradus TaxID=2259016 RepID=UPI0021DF6F67|nr:flagellar hook-associated protein FlgK [Edaphobacter bradus]